MQQVAPQGLITEYRDIKRTLHIEGSLAVGASQLFRAVVNELPAFARYFRIDEMTVEVQYRHAYTGRLLASRVSKYTSSTWHHQWAAGDLTSDVLEYVDGRSS